MASNYASFKSRDSTDSATIQNVISVFLKEILQIL
jgi:hypothetical protein